VVRPALLAGLALLMAGSAAAQQTPDAPTWRQIKCERYSKAWQTALARSGPQGLGTEFLARHAAFIASGCTGEANVCPRSPQELQLANIMIIAAMNAGTASTFPPFACRKGE
jgi:hypothetical protein